jgi:hypothetical protein
MTGVFQGHGAGSGPRFSGGSSCRIACAPGPLRALPGYALLSVRPVGNSAVSAPTVVSSSAAPVTCGALTVTIDWSTPADGYVVTLTPS